MWFLKRILRYIPLIKKLVRPTEKELIKELVYRAKKYRNVVEVGGKNRGPEIDRWSGQAIGKPWAMPFVLNLINEVNAFYEVSSSTMPIDILAAWRKTPASLRKTSPEVGDLIFWSFMGTVIGHVGIVLKVLDSNTVLTIEGNTNEAERVSNGNSVRIRTRSIRSVGKVQVLGFAKIWNFGKTKTYG